MKIFDSHAHYNDEKYNDDRQEVFEKLKNVGIDKVVSAGYNLESSKESIQLGNKYDFIYSTCGISPNDIPDTQEELEKLLEELENILKTGKKVVAIGEIGLDYHWNKENKELQKKGFIKQIELANKYNLPIQIHTREAVQDTIDILKQVTPVRNSIFHCCPLNQYLVTEGLKLGLYISIAGPITFKNSKNSDEILEIVPLDKMLIETDSPYLAPEPKRGTRNDSSNLIYILEKIAKNKNIPIEDVAKITYENAKKVFNIK